MRINPNDPAMPCEVLQEFPDHNNDFLMAYPGMDIRTEISTRAMQAMLSNPEIVNKLPGSEYLDSIAGRAVEMANIMIDQLNKSRYETGSK